jgi:hypothetical protein
MISTTPSPLKRGHPSFKKEGKLLRHSTIIFSSSSEEEYPRLVGREVVR